MIYYLSVNSQSVLKINARNKQQADTKARRWIKSVIGSTDINYTLRRDCTNVASVASVRKADRKHGSVTHITQ